MSTKLDKLKKFDYLAKLFYGAVSNIKMYKVAQTIEILDKTARAHYLHES